MKTICLLIFLALVGMAWGGNIEYCAYFEGDIIHGGIWRTIPCNSIETKKGHCPHCGTKRVGDYQFKLTFKDDDCKREQLPTTKHEKGWINCRSDCEEDTCYLMICDTVYEERCGLNVYRCPNGHLWWEKGE